LDEATVREFLRTDYPRLVMAVSIVADSRSTAEDCVQEALLRAWERSESGERIESLAGWVATVALNLSRSHLRRILAERRARSRTGQESALFIPGPSSDRIDVERAVATLPRRQREVVVLRYLLDMGTSDVAAVLKVSEGTVKSSLARARATLARELHVSDVEELNDVEP
jgi:RNA polymerase sigma-70 factor, ECF subfamily